jgi:type IV pilus assembly protein PilW
MALVNRRSKAFTLVELMVVLAILGVVTVGVLSLVTSQNKAYHSEEGILDLQMNTRISANYITRYLRMAGFGCYGNISSSNQVNGFNDSIDAANGTAAAAPNLLSPDTLTVVTAVRRVGVVDDGDGVYDKTYPSTSNISIVLDDTSYDLSNYFDTVNNKYLYLAPSATNRFLTVNTVNSGSKTLTIDQVMRVDEGAEVYPVKAFTFALDASGNLTVDNNTGSGAQTVAENIENIQFQYGWDRNNDGVFDPTDMNDWDNDASDKVKAVRIYILGRSANQDRDYTDTKKYLINDPTASNNNAVEAGPFNDHFHRFLLRTVVLIRNLNL